MADHDYVRPIPGAYTTHKATCPYCGAKDLEADWVDVGIGLVQCGPFMCDGCGAMEAGPHDENPRDEDEKRTGWFKPGKVGTSVNTCCGVPVDHQTALQLYRAGFLDEKVSLSKVLDTTSPLTEWDEQHIKDENPDLPSG